jgi:hypothetical protein
MAQDQRLIGFHIPEDEELLAAFGVVSIRHGHLDYLLKMTIRQLTGLSVDDARDAMAYENSSSLRKRIKRFARQAIGDCPELLKLQALMERCKRATEKRNLLMHNVYVKVVDGDPMMTGRDGTYHALPTVDELDNLSDELKALGEELNDARLNGGYLELALQKKARTKRA